MKDNISDGDIKYIIEALLKSEYERPALEIESYTTCILLGTLKKKNKNAISHLERHIAGKISSKFRLSVRTPDIPVQIESRAFVTKKFRSELHFIRGDLHDSQVFPDNMPISSISWGY